MSEFVGLRPQATIAFEGTFVPSDEMPPLSMPTRATYRFKLGTWRLFWLWTIYYSEISCTGYMQVTPVKHDDGTVVVNATLKGVQDYLCVKAPLWMRVVHFCLAAPCVKVWRFVRGF